MPFLSCMIYSGFYDSVKCNVVLCCWVLTSDTNHHVKWIVFLIDKFVNLLVVIVAVVDTNLFTRRCICLYRNPYYANAFV